MTGYLTIWFYYIPFVAISFNFSVPYLEEKIAPYFVEKTVVGALSEAELALIAAKIACLSAGSDYDEPTPADMLLLMEDTPLQADGTWVQAM